jgi:DNA mismatch endonuclease (patch repair protein)
MSVSGNLADAGAVKTRDNKARDLLVNRTLRKAGWRIVHIWEHELKKTRVHRALRKLRAAGLMR